MTIINILITIAIGLLLVWVLMPQKSLIERLGLSFPVGIGLVTFILFLLNAAFGFRFSLPGMLAAESVLFLALLAIFLARIKPAVPKLGPKIIKPTPGFLVNLFLLVIIFAFIGASFSIATYWPPYIFDALANFDFRGRVFAQEGTITGIADVLHASYPLLTSLAHTWAYLTGTQNPKFIYPLFYLSLLVVFWSVSRRHLSPLGTTALTLILATTPIVFEHSLISYTNLAHSFYLSLGIIFLAEYFLEKKREDLLASSILFGLTAWVRPAGETYLAAFGFLLLLLTFRTRRWLDLVPFFGVFLLFKFSWSFYQRNVLQAPPYDEWDPTLLSGLVGLNWGKIEPVWSLFWTNLKDFKFFGATGWFFAFMASASLPLLRFFKKKIPFLTALMVTLVTIGVWTGISLLIGESWGYSSDWRWILGQSMKRMMIIFPPLFLYVVATSPLVGAAFPKAGQK